MKHRFLNRLRRAEDGLAAIEFAMIIPVMLITFFGVSELANFILSARKVSTVASTAADLVSQEATINTAEMTDVMKALDVIMSQFDVTKATVRITGVEADDNGKTTVSWSDARNTNPYTKGQAITVPDLVPANQGIVMAEVSFKYQTFFGMYFTNGMTVADKFYLKPRRSTTVERVP